ncbi:carboxymuconolactone decarboxylase family protein [Actinosynnema sp. NPDC023658]|uniref:carboxymuconolactone decarboxylase family protein n=1 Tax=Actinosynnema sp. NPDC023658 TaxID=3155465 RepID=UPI003407A184
MKNPAMVLPDAMKGIQNLLKATAQGGVPRLTLELIGLRASQINGCGACLYGHLREAREAGETDERLATVAAWRHTPFFTDAERAALALTEAVTRIADRTGEAVPDDVWAEAAAHYDEQQLSAIVLMIATLNFFNRLNVTVQERADRPSWEG